MDNHLTDYLRANAARTPDKAALITNERSLSWHELWQEVEAAASAISENIDNTDQQVIALLMPNSWQFVVSYLGVVHAGHIAMPVDVIYKQLEIDAILGQIKPVLLITDTPERTSTEVKKLASGDLKASGK